MDDNGNVGQFYMDLIIGPRRWDSELTPSLRFRGHGMVLQGQRKSWEALVSPIVEHWGLPLKLVGTV